MLQYGYSLDCVFLVVRMQLNSKTYVTVVLSGIVVICIVCLLLRWRFFAQQQDSPQLGLRRGPIYFTEPATASGQTRPASSGEAEPGRDSDGSAAQEFSDEAQLPASQAGQDLPIPDTIDINTAGIKELQNLPGIGPVLASRICSYRQTHGIFKSIDALAEVEGIGTAKLDSLRPLIRIGNQH